MFLKKNTGGLSDIEVWGMKFKVWGLKRNELLVWKLFDWVDR